MSTRCTEYAYGNAGEENTRCRPLRFDLSLSAGSERETTCDPMVMELWPDEASSCMAPTSIGSDRLEGSARESSSEKKIVTEAGMIGLESIANQVKLKRIQAASGGGDQTPFLHLQILRRPVSSHFDAEADIPGRLPLLVQWSH